MEKAKLFAARDADGDLYLYPSMPERVTEEDHWGHKDYWSAEHMVGRVDPSLLPKVTWEGEPQEVMITIVPKEQDDAQG